ncbi:MAG: hypothetical protein ACTHLA_07460 [Asticcacaulis sp.]|uniref:hypothetical protein n=1 Tax=Asticcacaulis sp. TaxID=1872648 RepID=UPI003F7BE28B
MGFRPESVGGWKMHDAARSLSYGAVRIGLFSVALVSMVAMSACASKPHYRINESPAAPQATSAPDAESGSEEGTMRSSTQQDNNWGDAFTAPLEDLNLKRQAIPAILQSAITKPYDLTGLDTCEAIAGEVAQLDTLLGADFDEPPTPKGDPSMTEKGQRMAGDAAVGAVRSASRSIIPFRGIVRKMTGAERHEREVDTAIQAGKVRRAYLKGVGMNKNCAPPAAPSWFKPRVYVQTYTDAQQAQPAPTTQPDPEKKRKPTRRRYR